MHIRHSALRHGTPPMGSSPPWQLSRQRLHLSQASGSLCSPSTLQRETAPNVFTEITVVHNVEGDVETAAVRRSIELSATKYCTVSAQIASGVARISHRYLIRRPAGVANRPAEEEGEVVVTGPSKDVLAV